MSRALLPWRKTVKAVLVHPKFSTPYEPSVLSRVATAGKQKYMEFPGGGVEDGETLTQAIHRELKEETGVTPQNLQYRGVVQQPWPESFKAGDRFAKKAYDKYQGSEIHFFTGHVGAQRPPTSKEGDRWLPVTVYKAKALLEHFASNPQKGWEPTAKASVNALQWVTR